MSKNSDIFIKSNTDKLTSDNYQTISTPSDFKKIANIITNNNNNNPNKTKYNDEKNTNKLSGGARKSKGSRGSKGSKRNSKSRGSRGSRGTKGASRGKRGSTNQSRASTNQNKGSRSSKGSRGKRGSKGTSKSTKSRSRSRSRGSNNQNRSRSSKGSKRGSKKGSKRGSKGRKQSRTGSNNQNSTRSRAANEDKPKRTMAPGMIAFRELAEYIALKMGEKFSPKIIKMASQYKKQVESENPGITSVEATKKARVKFDNDSTQERNKKLEQSIIIRKSKNTDSAYSSTSE